MTPSGMWSTVCKLAEQTPPTRNRYVDFLRAVSICVVVFGHWLVSLPSIVDGEWHVADVLRVEPWFHWLTWAFQVMPVFFIVGGYSNSVSWSSAMRKGTDFSTWAAARLQRLVGPLMPLLIFWSILAVIMRQLGVEPALMRVASQAALIPIWFLAVYILVTIATPLTHRLYRNIGVASFWAFALVAALVDLIAFSRDLPLLRWANYGFIWLAVHQLGYMWQDGRMAGPRRALPWAFGGLGLLVLLVTVAGYPISMLTVPGQAISNSRPPTLALLALGTFHAGVLLTLEAPARRWLQRIRPWALTVLVNSRIMTLFLWHLTVMILLVGVSMQFDGIGLRAEAGSAEWWISRVPWIILMLTVLLVFIALFGHYEQPSKHKAPATLPTWRVVTGSILLCFGLALMATGGITDEGPIGLRLEAVLPAFVGMFLALPGVSFRRRSA